MWGHLSLLDVDAASHHGLVSGRVEALQLLPRRLPRASCDRCRVDARRRVRRCGSAVSAQHVPAGRKGRNGTDPPRCGASGSGLSRLSAYET